MFYAVFTKRKEGEKKWRVAFTVIFASLGNEIELPSHSCYTS